MAEYTRKKAELRLALMQLEKVAGGSVAFSLEDDGHHAFIRTVTTSSPAQRSTRASLSSSSPSPSPSPSPAHTA